ncbi:hypothetical protein HNQ44_003012 [Planomicrobium koreense]|uniref:Uncharacterized protein n=1 Tax=Planococcus koreensis TaxID=112331 RepID=A0A7W8CWK1_9BACL|nr:hypothetical protein [Planococcus koreensis]MBB5181547.1 hypothetical protein [Planococcus koreensis]
MFGFLYRTKLIKDDLKGIAKFMYLDVSEDSWDQENLTKTNLDFTIESVRYIDEYIYRLLNTDYGTELLDKHFDNFMVRIGAYIGEVIKNNVNEDFYWYESGSVRNYSSDFDGTFNTTQTVLYSKKRDIVILPLDVVVQFLKGNSPYTSLLSYVEVTIKENS